MNLPDFEAWAIFAAVVEHRSFSGAAAALGLSKATVSKAISRLETRLATSLFHRTSRRLTLTDSGQQLAERAQRILAEGEAAEEAARDSAALPTGRVRLAVPLSFGLKHVAPVIADFLVAHPGIHIDLCLSDAKIDIVSEGIDVALRIANLRDSSLRARRLSGVDMHLVAATSYFDRHGRPTHPAQLAEHACITYANAANPDVWRFRKADGEEAVVRVRGPLMVDNGDAVLPALRAGLGIALLPGFIIADDLASGMLETILSPWTGSGLELHLLTPPGRLRPTRVEALIVFLTERLKDVCAYRESTRLVD